MNAPSKTQSFPLAMANEDDIVRIDSIIGCTTFARRISEMGLNVGCEIVVHQRQGGGLVISRGETRFALGAGMAHKILVSKV